MGIYFGVYEASGRAKCRICNKIIALGETQVTAHGWKDQGSVHLSCLEIFEVR